MTIDNKVGLSSISALEDEESLVRVLVADDDPISLEVLVNAVEQVGHMAVPAESGDEAWEHLCADPRISVAIIDWLMPGLDGLQLCQRIKQEISDRYVYTVMVTSKDSKDDLVKGMAAGADDFMSKPVHYGELNSRLYAGERVLRYERSLKLEGEKSDRLLNSILPKSIADRLKRGETEISDYVDDCSVMFVDLCGFSEWCLSTDPRELIRQLDGLFRLFDSRIRQSGVEKIKSIGDAYLIAAGLPEPRPDHARALAELALNIRADVENMSGELEVPWSVRTGIASGPVVGGVIGVERFIYDVWGPTVNLAARLEALAPPGGILVSDRHRQLLDGVIPARSFGQVKPKGFAEQRAWLIG